MIHRPCSPAPTCRGSASTKCSANSRSRISSHSCSIRNRRSTSSANREWIDMTMNYACLALVLSIFASSAAKAEEATVSYKSIGLELALDAARAALQDCQKRGYQVAVAVVDRFGTPQVLLRDRFAGPHTPPTATGKAWTSATFRNSTTELNAISQP